MIFTLEALQADEGDSLILHYGDPAAPGFIVIDGGPSGIYRQALRPRLHAIKQRWSPNDPLPIDMLMVSHVDDDHIVGVLDLTTELIDLDDQSQPLPFEIATLWFNSFNDVIGDGAREIFTNVPAGASAADVSAAVPGLKLTGSESEVRDNVAVMATVAKGRTLRDQAARLTIALNDPFGGLIMLPAAGSKPFEWQGTGLRFTVLAPDERRIKILHAKWEAAVKKARLGDGGALTEAYNDTSPFNLSSIVVLVELSGKRILLSGDGRGDDILEGFKRAGLLHGAHDTFKLDVFKMPHHGSDRNMKVECLRQLPAGHYVISANGKHDNPDMDTLEMIAAARGNAAYRIHLTNQDGQTSKGPLRKLLDDLFVRQPGLKDRVVFRKPDQPSLKVDLLQKVTY